MKHKAHWTILIIIAALVGIFIYSQSMWTVDIPTTPSKTASKPVTRPVTPQPKPATIPTAQNTSLKTYTDSRLNASFAYPTDWTLNTNQSYPYSFWVTKAYNGENYNLVSIAQTDGCRPDLPSTLDGKNTYDTGWRGTKSFTRTICFIDKKYLINLTAADSQSKAVEETILSTVKVN